MNILFLSTLSWLAISTTSIYTISIPGANGNAINFNDFQGKKILVVNIASNSPMAFQIGELQQLKQQYGNGLVVIACPSNSFGNEPMTNQDIYNYCHTNFDISFLLGAKADVIGTGTPPLYQWLTQSSLNGSINSTVKSDFQKYIISETGELVGVFLGSVSPLDQQIATVLNTSYSN